MAISLCPVIYAAETNVTSGTCGDNLTWTLDDEGTLTISGTGEMDNNYSAVHFPSVWSKLDIKNVIINDGVTTIGASAFYECKKLISISIPNSVIHIGESAFAYCWALEEITLPANIKEIEGGTFFYCANLKKVNFPEKLEKIGSHAFQSCHDFEQVIIPESVKWIGEYAFEDCDSLISAELPKGIKIISDSLFANCKYLVDVNIPDSVIHIGEAAFYECKSLENIKLPRNLIRIGEQAFWRCENLKEISLPESLEWIGFGAFAASGLTSVSIPESVIRIDSDAFYWCKNLTSVNIPRGIKKIESSTFADCEKLTDIIIPNSVMHIEYCAFENCKNLSNITISENIKSIKAFAFENTAYYNDENNWKNNALYIGTNLIKVKENVVEFEVIHGTKIISGDAFAECSKLENIEIPDSIEWIGLTSFTGSPAFANTKYYQDTDNWKDDVLYINNALVGVSKEISEMNIKEGTTVIADGVFDGCCNLKSVEIPEGIESIGEQTFSCCSSLETVSLPESIKFIDDYAFNSCSKLQYIDIPQNVEWIGCDAFYESGLQKVSDLKEVSYIGEGAFRKTPMTNINISENVTFIGKRAFEDSRLENINLSNGVKWIEDEAFARSGLTDINLPDSVVWIGKQVFDNCQVLEQARMSNTIKFIDDLTFASCLELKKLELSDSIEVIGESAFSGVNRLKDILFWGDEKQWNNIILGAGNTSLLNATIHFLGEQQSGLTISAPTNSYAGTYYTFEATFDKMPTSAFLSFDSPADNWTWFSDEYCSTNPVFNIPTDEIVEKDGKYVYQISFVIYSSGNESDSYNRQVRVVADIDGTRQYSGGAKFVVKPTPERPKNTAGYLYEQTSNPTGDTVAPEIRDVSVSGSNGSYTLKVTDFVAENEDWVFFYWQTDSGELEGVTESFDTVELSGTNDATVTVTMGDGCGYITTKTVEISK